MTLKDRGPGSGVRGPTRHPPGATAHVSEETRFAEIGEFGLESGHVLHEVRVAYRTWGALAPSGDNAVVVCHALTGSADADAWWPDLLGPGRALDPGEDFIVCSNILGSCYGTTGPTSPFPGSSRPYGPEFPAVTVRDMVNLQARVLEALEVRRIRLVIGGSLGGMQALEWAAMYPNLVEAIAALATSGRHSAWCIGLSEAQRAAILADPDFRGGRYRPDRPPAAGLAAARMIAMCTYRSSESFSRRFGRGRAENGGFEVERYLRHHGEALVARFDANSYLTLTRAMDTHDLGRGRAGYAQALRAIRADALVVAVESDVLYPPEEQRELVSLIPGARLALLHSPDGHDAFLTEGGAVSDLVRDFRARLAGPPASARWRERPAGGPLRDGGRP